MLEGSQLCKGQSVYASGIKFIDDFFNHKGSILTYSYDAFIA